MPAAGGGRSFTNGRLRIGSRDTELPQESAFTILFQNCPKGNLFMKGPPPSPRRRRSEIVGGVRASGRDPPGASARTAAVPAPAQLPPARLARLPERWRPP